MSEQKSTTRYRNFACVVYPDSAPVDWKEILSAHLIPTFISPLHDKDVNPNGEPKKPHYHVMLMYDGVKSPEQVAEVFSSFGGVGCEIVKSIRGYARYLCHLDNPEKAQYDQGDVVSLAGADYVSTIGLAIDKYKAIREMIDYCEEHNIISYAELLRYCMSDRFDWFRILCDNGTYVVKEYLKSREWERKAYYGN